jgi:hypothetical protein
MQFSPTNNVEFWVGLNDLSFSTENRDLKHYDFGIVKAAVFLGA